MTSKTGVYKFLIKKLQLIILFFLLTLRCSLNDTRKKVALNGVVYSTKLTTTSQMETDLFKKHNLNQFCCCLIPKNSSCSKFPTRASSRPFLFTLKTQRFTRLKTLNFKAYANLDTSSNLNLGGSSNKIQVSSISKQKKLPLVDALAHEILADFVAERIILNPLFRIKIQDCFEDYLCFVYNRPNIHELAQIYGIKTETFKAFLTDVKGIKRTANYPKFIIPKRGFARILEFITREKANKEIKSPAQKESIKLIRSQVMFLKGAGVVPSLREKKLF